MGERVVYLLTIRTKSWFYVEIPVCLFRYSFLSGFPPHWVAWPGPIAHGDAGDVWPSPSVQRAVAPALVSAVAVSMFPV